MSSSMSRVQGLADLLLVALGLGLDGEGHGRLRDVDPGELDRTVLGAQGVAGDGDLELGDAADVARDQLGDVGALLALEDHQVAEALGLLDAAVVGRRVAVQRAGDDAQDGDLAGEGIGEGLEHQRRERTGRIGGELDGSSPPRFRAGKGARSAGEGSRERKASSSAEGPTPWLAETRVTGKIWRRATAPSQALLQVFLRQGAVLEEALHQPVVGLGHRLDQAARGGPRPRRRARRGSRTGEALPLPSRVKR